MERPSGEGLIEKVRSLRWRLEEIAPCVACSGWTSACVVSVGFVYFCFLSAKKIPFL